MTARTLSGAEPPLHARVGEILRGEILGGMEPGARLLESRVAARLGVSRAPARHALADLCAEGLLTRAQAPDRGYTVTERAAAIAPQAGRPQAAPQVPAPLSVRLTWQRLEAEVEQAITSRIAFGSWRVIETALARHYDVSRTVAREVLAHLQTRGLVINEGKRWIAPALSDRRVEELYSVRAVLEAAALEAAAPHLPADQIAAMAGRLRDAAARRVSGTDLDALEVDLHVALLGHCPNAMLHQAMVQHQSLLLAHRFLYHWTADMYPVEPFLAEHLAVLEPLEAGRFDAAKRAMTDHLLASRARAVMRIARVRDLVGHADLAYLERMPA